MQADFIMQLIAMGGMVAGVYAAIRADLVRAMVKAEQAGQTADEAHKRIDKYMGGCKHA